MEKDSNNFLSSQKISDKDGSDLNFINKIIFYNEDAKFLTTRAYINGEWKVELYEYDYNLKEMVSSIEISTLNITAEIHPFITVPTVMIKDYEYTMYTYYIAKIALLKTDNTYHSWRDKEEILTQVIDGSFTSVSINNLRRFIELLFENEGAM